MAEVKKANTHAWGFEPEFRDAMIAIAADREEFKAAVTEINRIHAIYNASLAHAADDVAVRFEERAERIVRDIFGQHFENIRIERKYEDEKRMRDQWQSVQMMVGRAMGEVTAKVDALTQSPQGTAPETPL